MAANLFTHDQEDLPEQERKTPLSARDAEVKESNESEESPSEQEIEEISEGKAENYEIAALRKCKSWLGQQKIDYNTELIKCRLQQSEDLQTFPSDKDDLSDICERITKLQEELFNIASTKSYGKVVLERLLQGDMLLKILFPDIVTENPSQDHIDKMNEFGTICTRNNDICFKILQHHKEITETQQRLDKVKQQNYEIKKTNRELMTKLQNLKARRNVTPNSSSENDAVSRAKQENQNLHSKLNSIANVFQGLIVGSGINWAANDDTRQLVLNIGEIMNAK